MLLFAFFIQQFDCVSDSADLFSNIVGDFSVEFLFESHDQFHNVQRITIKELTEAVTRLRELSPLWEMHQKGIDTTKVQWAKM